MGLKRHLVATLAALSRASSCTIEAPAESEPENVDKLHPGHVSVVMSMGDSISAGWLAEGLLLESRGVAFPGGAGTAEKRTLPYYLRQYNSSLLGASEGVHEVEIAKTNMNLGPSYGGYHFDGQDHMNAALSFAWTYDLLLELEQLKKQSKLIPDFDARWKVLTIFMGANDISTKTACENKSVSDALVAQSEHYYERALKAVVQTFDKIYINVVGIMPVASVGRVIRNTTHCRGADLLLKNGYYCIAQATDAELEKLEYTWGQLNDRLKALAAKYNHYSPNHAVVYQDVLASHDMPNAAWISRWDCMHPSAIAHNESATLLWNAMLTGVKTPALLTPPIVPVCPSSTSYFATGQRQTGMRTLMNANETQRLVETLPLQDRQTPERGRFPIAFAIGLITLASCAIAFKLVLGRRWQQRQSEALVSLSDIE